MLEHQFCSEAVVTWGDPASGGDSLDVWDQLAGGVVDLSHTSSAFAARKEDGSVVPGSQSSIEPREPVANACQSTVPVALRQDMGK